MDAVEARMLTLDNFNKIKNEKINMVLDKIKESAENGYFVAYLGDTTLSFTEASHLRALGYEVEIEYGQRMTGRAITCTSDVIIKW